MGYKVGDVVTLKSGGPPLVVAAVMEDALDPARHPPCLRLVCLTENGDAAVILDNLPEDCVEKRP